MDTKFVTHVSDSNGNLAVSILAGLGYATEVISDDGRAADGTVALFTPVRPIWQGQRGRFLRCSAIKLVNGVAPEWAVNTPFRVAVLRTEREDRTCKRNTGGLEQAVRVMAQAYQSWNPGEGFLVPWSCYEKDPSIKPDSACVAAAKQWLSGVNLTIIVRSSKSEPRPQDESMRHMLVNDWRVNYSDEPVIFRDNAVAAGLDLLSGWHNHFPKEATWSQRELNIPSLIVRLDCVVRDGKLVVYEVEERPSGMGISSVINPFFAQQLTGVSRTWPDFDVVVSNQRAGTDDYIWVEKLSRRRGSDLVLVRAEPEETQYHDLEPHSVSTLKAKGDKRYGEQLGLWHRVKESGQLSWDQSFVLKPLQGSKMKEVVIWDVQRRPGSSNRQQVESAFGRNDSEMFFQEFEDPLETGRPKFRWMIYRVYFGFNVRSGQWECLGGFWNARSNLRIHGASDALLGPIVLA